MGQKENDQRDKEMWQRQKQVLNYRSAGYSVEEIATKLDVSQATVKTDLQRIYRRLADFLIMDGSMLGDLLSKCDNLLNLALAGFSRANRVVSVRVEGTVDRELVTTEDWYARAQLLGKALEAVRLQARILGFEKSDGVNVVNFLQPKNDLGQGAAEMQINDKDIPQIRKHMRAVRRLVHAEAVKTVLDAEQVNERRGIKNPPGKTELPGVIFDTGVEDGDDLQVDEAERETRTRAV